MGFWVRKNGASSRRVPNLGNFRNWHLRPPNLPEIPMIIGAKRRIDFWLLLARPSNN